MKVAELTGCQLDEWVARAEGYTLIPHRHTYSVERPTIGGDIECVGWIGDEYEPQFTPSTNPAQGQPIMEREHIGTQFMPMNGYWLGMPTAEKALPGKRVPLEGPTQLVAGMRARVWMVYGDEVPA